MDYSRLIDEETWAFIERTGEFYPPDAISMTIADQRRVYDEMCREFFTGYPPGVSAIDRSANGVPIRVYEKAKSDTNVVYFHGGGFVVGGLESHDDICAEICDRTGFRVISVDYSLCPENKFPADFEDARTAVQYVAERWLAGLILVGDSAGANLAAAVSHDLRDELDISGQLLIYGVFGGDVNMGSYLTHADAPLLSRDEVLFYSKIRFDGEAPLSEPRAWPLQDTDFSGLPPSVIFSAQCDPLSDDSHAYRDAILDAGGQVALIEEKGLVHGYLRARSMVTRARVSFTRIVNAISELGNDQPFPPNL